MAKVPAAQKAGGDEGSSTSKFIDQSGYKSTNPGSENTNTKQRQEHGHETK